MTSKEIYDAGYAVPLYDIAVGVQHFQFREERFMNIPVGAIPMHDVPGVNFKLARIEDLRNRD